MIWNNLIFLQKSKLTLNIWTAETASTIFRHLLIFLMFNIFNVTWR